MIPGLGAERVPSEQQSGSVTPVPCRDITKQVVTYRSKTKSGLRSSFTRDEVGKSIGFDLSRSVIS